MGRCFAKHSMTSSKVCSSVRTGAIAGVFTYATSKQMLSMVGGSLNLRRLKFKAIRDGIPLWRKLFDLLIIDCGCEASELHSKIISCLPSLCCLCIRGKCAKRYEVAP